jgi:hypothetical protein
MLALPFNNYVTLTKVIKLTVNLPDSDDMKNK